MTTRILVVDDEPDLEALIQQKFRHQIYDGTVSFLFAHDRVEALARLEANRDVDAVVADIYAADGRAIAPPEAAGERKKLSTIIVSAYGDMANIRTAMNRGAFDFLTKPIDFLDLETTIIVSHGPCSNALPSQRVLAELQTKTGSEGLLATPSTDSTPAETTDAGSEVGNGGDGPCDPPPGYARQRGRRMPADRPITCQALPSGSATKRVPPFDFTRNNNVRLPSLRASAICVRTSAGLETDLPLTSRMTSPTWKP